MARSTAARKYEFIHEAEEEEWENGRAGLVYFGLRFSNVLSESLPTLRSWQPVADKGSADEVNGSKKVDLIVF